MLKKQRTKEEAKRKLRQQRLHLVNRIAELGVQGSLKKKLRMGLMKFASEKGRQKALVTQLQFQESCLYSKSDDKGTLPARKNCERQMGPFFS